MKQAMEARTYALDGVVCGLARAVGKAFFAFVRFLQQLELKPASISFSTRTRDSTLRVE